jgi:hypothetical protein
MEKPGREAGFFFVQSMLKALIWRDLSALA